MPISMTPYRVFDSYRTVSYTQLGHVTAARAAMEVRGLDKLVLVPDAQPPHKALPEGGAAPRQRYDMAVLATAALGKRAEVSDMELRRSGVSYTCLLYTSDVPSEWRSTARWPQMPSHRRTAA